MKKWALRILGILTVVLIGVIVYIEIYKDNILAVAIEEANKSINGEITYKEADISLLRSFPSLRLIFSDLNVTSKVSDTNNDLFNSDEFNIDISILSLLKKKEPVKINAIAVDGAQLFLTIDEEELSNFDILKESDTTQESNVDFSIEEFSIKNSVIEYTNKKERTHFKFKDFNSSGQLDYIKGYIKTNNKVTAHVLIDLPGIMPSYGLNISENSVISINPGIDTLSIENMELLANHLPLRLNGLIAINQDDIDYQIQFDSPESDIKQFASLLPAYYKSNYSDLISSGSFILNGNIQGITSQPHPRFEINATATNGSLSYPSMRQKIDQLNFKINARNDSYNSLYSKISVDNLSIKSGDNFVTGNLNLGSKNKQDEIDFHLNTDLNLSDLKNIVILSAEEDYSGNILGKIEGSGIFTNGKVSQASLPKINSDLQLSNVKIHNNNTFIELENANIKSDNNELVFKLDKLLYNEGLDANITGKLNNPLPLFFDENHLLTGSIEMTSNKVDLNKISNKDSITQTKYNIPSTDIDFTFKANELLTYSYTLTGISSSGKIRKKGSNIKFKIDNFYGSEIDGSGVLDDVLNYGINNDTLTGRLNIVSNKVYLDRWMNQETESNIEDIEGLIPGNLDLDIDFKSDQIVFKNLGILESLGQVSIRDRKILFKNDGSIFGGKILLTGIFNEKKSKGYHLDLNLELKKLKFSETASSSQIFNQIIPIAKLLEGDYTATLNWKSDLNDAYMPDLSTLSAYGEIATNQGKIVGRLPVDTFLRRFVTIGEEKSLQISDAKKYFIIENGRIIVKKIDLVRDDVTLSFSGSHGFNQDLDYEIEIDIPKSKFKSDGIISLIQDKLKFSELLKSQTENIKVQVVGYMGGSIMKPAFQFKKVNLKSGSNAESITEVAKATFDDFKNTAANKLKDTISSTRAKIESKVDQTKQTILTQIDSVRTGIKTGIDSVKKVTRVAIDKEKEKVTSDGTMLLDSIKSGNVDNLGKTIDDLFGKRQGMLDSLKIKAPIDIFKKKKKGAGN